MVSATQGKNSYTIEGVIYDRISTVLTVISNEYQDWYRKVGIEEADRVSKEATDIGSYVHDLASRDILGKKAEIKVKDFTNDEGVVDEIQLNAVTNCFEAYKLWRSERKFPENAILDFKTSRKVEKIYWMQLAAYWLAFMEKAQPTGVFSEHLVWSDMFGYAGTSDLICNAGGEMQLIVIRLDKDLGTYEQHVCMFSKLELSTKFLNTLDLYRFLKKENKDVLA